MSIHYSTKAFEDKYTYSGTDLGVTWTPEKTCFRLWAPTARAVTVNLYAGGTAGAEDLLAQLTMRPAEQGTWTAERLGNLSGLYYTYLVCVDGTTREVCDPYARSTGVNGHRAMILDLASTNPEGWDRDADPHAGMPISDAVLYELHIRDLSMDRSSHISHKGKYLGLTETGKKTRGGCPTGLDHIKALGITHLHLLPVYDYGFTDEASPSPAYNWGYDPVNFNVPEGSYATNPCDGAVRVREMKQMVKTLHCNGISVVMDVVYNHVFDGETFCLNQIVPGYFSRKDSNGVYSDGSCCGNDTASERSMVRKYIVDSVCYWAEEYHIDGFRFDLVGLIDTDTINAIMSTVHQRHPNVIFYGEGWTMNTVLTKPDVQLCIQPNSGSVPGFSFFNDTLRDLMRGSVFFQERPGFVSGAVCRKEELDRCFMGIPAWADQPYQCVNYVSCHDNNTLFDRLALAAPQADRETLIRMNKLAAAFSFLSQGVPFLQAGEELLRTKPGKQGLFDENSYRAPDKVNSIKWSTLDDPQYQDTLRYYQGLIAFRKAHPGLRHATREMVLSNVHPLAWDNDHALAYLVEEAEQELLVLFNADTQPLTYPLPQGRWEVKIGNGQAGTSTLASAQDLVTVPPISAMVLVRKKFVDVVAALIWEKDKFLICQRPAHKTRGLKWEFVGGKVEPGETMEAALRRECREELDITVDVGSEFYQLVHEYPDLRIRLTLFHCVIAQGTPTLLEHNALAWIHPRQIGQYDFCPADVDILKVIRKRYGNHPPLES